MRFFFFALDCVSQETCDKCLDQHSTCAWCSDRVRSNFLFVKSSKCALEKINGKEKEEQISKHTHVSSTKCDKKYIKALKMLIRRLFTNNKAERMKRKNSSNLSEVKLRIVLLAVNTELCLIMKSFNQWMEADIRATF